jgi:hypothetical protein
MKIIRDGNLHLYLVIWQLRRNIFLARFCRPLMSFLIAAELHLTLILPRSRTGTR